MWKSRIWRESTNMQTWPSQRRNRFISRCLTWSWVLLLTVSHMKGYMVMWPNQRSHCKRLHAELPYNKRLFCQMTDEFKFMPGDYTFSSGGSRNCHTILSFQPNSTVKSIILWEGEGKGGAMLPDDRAHIFLFSLLSSPRSFLSLISIIIRRFLCFLLRPWQMLHTGEEHEYHSVCLFCRLSPSHTSGRASSRLTFRSQIHSEGLSSTFCTWAFKF